jgi:hypothetical protein
MKKIISTSLQAIKYLPFLALVFCGEKNGSVSNKQKQCAPNTPNPAAYFFKGVCTDYGICPQSEFTASEEFGYQKGTKLTFVGKENELLIDQNTAYKFSPCSLNHVNAVEKFSTELANLNDNTAENNFCPLLGGKAEIWSSPNENIEVCKKISIPENKSESPTEEFIVTKDLKDKKSKFIETINFLGSSELQKYCFSEQKNICE